MIKQYQVESVLDGCAYRFNELIIAESAEEAIKRYQDEHPEEIAYAVTDCDLIDEDKDFDVRNQTSDEDIYSFFEYNGNSWSCRRGGVAVLDSIIYPLVECGEAYVPRGCVPIIRTMWGKHLVSGYVKYDRNSKSFMDIVVRKDCPLTTLLFTLRAIMNDSLIDLRKAGVA